MATISTTNSVTGDTEITGNKKLSSYDSVPYASFPYPYSSHERMYTIGKLFGMQPADYQKARVLELGCASGGNILPLASQFPDSEFIGIDASQVQVDKAKSHVRNLGLKNIEFRCQSIMDITDDLGIFDYIITHGILSWVTPDVQDKIFTVCNKNLSDNGIAYISYNTYPAWNFIKSLRDMMLYHTANFSDPAKKISEAANLLEFIRKANPERENNPYLQVITNELKMLEKLDPTYLYHEHLEEHNEPFYFYQFMRKAQVHSLQYLGEVSLSSMFLGNLAAEAAKILGQIANDIVRLEQYMDFIRNRRFRCTLLVHDNVKINRNLIPHILQDFFLTTGLRTDAIPKNIHLSSGGKVNFTIPYSKTSYTTSSVEVITALNLLIQSGGKPVATKKLIQDVREQLGKKFNQDSENTILTHFLRLVLADAINIHSSAGYFTNRVSHKPRASSYARYQATRNAWITNQKFEKIDIDMFTRIFLQYLDGSNDIESIYKKMLHHFEKNELQMNESGQRIQDMQEIEYRLKPLIDKHLLNLAARSILVS